MDKSVERGAAQLDDLVRSQDQPKTVPSPDHFAHNDAAVQAPLPSQNNAMPPTPDTVAEDHISHLNQEAAPQYGLVAQESCYCSVKSAALHLGANVTAVTDVHANGDKPEAVTACDETPVTAVSPSDVCWISVPEQDRPCFRVIDSPTCIAESGAILRPGVWFFTVKSRKQDQAPQLTEEWVCSPLHIEAITHDEYGNNFGRKLRFMNALGQWREWAMPMELLRGHGEELRGELLSMGLHIDPGGHRLLSQYLQTVVPTFRLKCATQAGWFGNAFVLPNQVLGPGADGVIFQNGERAQEEYTKGGTLEGWQSEVARHAIGNPLLMLAISASFAGPLLAKCNAGSGGIHLVGDSSTGKTTLVEAGGATWGGPNYRRSWRATANGIEGAAALFNDSLLVLDEISECDPREVGAIVYALGNGRGKQRANRTGNARSVVQWRCIVLSTGERTIATSMAEGGYRVMAGQSVRLLDIVVNKQHGAWDELHGMESGAAFSDAIKRASATHYGHAGPMFVEKLAADSRDMCALLEEVKALPPFRISDGAGQEKRAADRLALVALAGELAMEYGITGWPKGGAIKAAAEALLLWRSMRGQGNAERQEILDRIARFIERHGDSRFSSADTPLGEDAIRANRAGWWREEATGRIYLFNTDGLREALKGLDFKRSLNVLEEAGVLPPAQASGERSKPFRIGGRSVRVYFINPDKLGG
jgi:putative DNA primase/helicase